MKDTINLLIATILFLYFGVFIIVLALLAARQSRRLLEQPGRCTGQVTGLLYIGLWESKTMGEVPAGAMNRMRTDTGKKCILPLFMRLFPWSPCVRYTVEGHTYSRVIGEGAREGVWRIGQTVHLRYDPAAPQTAAAEEDPSPQTVFRLDLLLGVVLLLAGVVCATVLALM